MVNEWRCFKCSLQHLQAHLNHWPGQDQEAAAGEAEQWPEEEEAAAAAATTLRIMMTAIACDEIDGSVVRARRSDIGLIITASPKSF